VSVALVIQHLKRMRRVILSSVSYSALLYIFTLSHKLHDFRGGGGEVIERKICVVFLLKLPETFHPKNN
jgi:hypothetical protein